MIINESTIVEQSVVDAGDTSFDVLIDYVDDEDFGKLYRVWKSNELLGSYYESLTGKWHAQISNLGGYIPCEDKELAIKKIIESGF